MEKIWKSYLENREDKINSTKNSLEKTERQIRSVYLDETLSPEEYGVMYDILHNIKRNLESSLSDLTQSPVYWENKIREFEEYLKICLSRLKDYEILLEEAEMEFEQYQLHK